MAISERTLRISGASVLALTFIGIAYVLSGPNLLTNRTVSAESAEELLAAYAAKDTDGDTLPDWQEALYGTNPNTPDSDGDGMSDGEAFRQGLLTPSSLAAQLPENPTGEELLEEIPGVDPAPGSITEQFGQEFLQAYAAASNGAPLDEAGQQQLVSQLLAQFTQKASTQLTSRYTLVSVRTDPTLSAVIYAGSVEDVVFRTHAVAPGGEGDPLLLMQAFIEHNDKTAAPKLEALADSYAAIAAELLTVSAPPALADEHLALIRSFDELARATNRVVVYESDPLGVMGALSIYRPSSQAIVQAFEQIALAVLASGEPAADTPGALIVNTARSASSL